jgi:hypothetical protein
VQLLPFASIRMMQYSSSSFRDETDDELIKDCSKLPVLRLSAKEACELKLDVEPPRSLRYSDDDDFLILHLLSMLLGVAPTAAPAAAVAEVLENDNDSQEASDDMEERELLVRLSKPNACLPVAMLFILKILMCFQSLEDQPKTTPL